MIEEKNKSSWRLYSSTNDNGQRKNVQKINRRSERPQIENSTVTRMQLAISYISELWMASFLYIANRVFFFSSLKVLTISMTIFVQSLFFAVVYHIFVIFAQPNHKFTCHCHCATHQEKGENYLNRNNTNMRKEQLQMLNTYGFVSSKYCHSISMNKDFFSVLKFHVERERNVKLCECGQFWSRTLV